ncbi:hypothetical protein FBR42_13750 [Salmonella enterica subsp. enterica serovar Hull]|nr:hypothetical protein [Salmonella enterica]EBS6328155.1 hypothetical protein [Salmonella enterica subsp. enterica serovar Virchow]ECC3449537.1 hypothetical protein [Salmonella enterica subsp. enterica serovar Javiana]ECG7219808.1 hypothetical protein [Salmonella enterica subsp. enterica serovar Hull]ECH9478876.1 hypothetical protein [Salmonella enterica subsp. enterica]EDU9171451.1 hypothetical protein [Salmonella enterica subsp. enterica serovar Kisangani]
MGHVVKSIMGGGSKKETSTQKSESTSQSFLMGNKQYQTATNAAIGEISNLNIPDYQLAQMPAQQQQALQSLMQGQNYDYLQQAQKTMGGYGSSLMSEGQKQLGGATDILSRLQNLSQEDYQKMLSSEMNNDLVNSQISQLKTDVNESVMKNLHGIDQGAIASGNMGSSRAGITSGVAIGAGAKAVASGSVQYRTAEESAAQNRLMSYLNLQGNTAGQLAGIGQNQMSMGMGAYGQSVGYGSQYTAGQLQNLQNTVNAGNMQRAYQQQQLDVSRQNALMNQSPSLTRLAYANQYLLPMAQLSQSSSGTVSSTQYAPQQGMLGGLMGMGGMALGSYLTGGQMSGESNTDFLSRSGQNMQMGGMFGSMAGRMFSS